ncbi:ABC transporter substrate-binding protein [Zavarzinia sp. CC-PAN008]|uniref:ABC transporter substrate-binding protein n=1 Tax=Zavarzinia sp. CC-PAN008 TaxID=3243332 RepID=UPI003F745010
MRLDRREVLTALAALGLGASALGRAQAVMAQDLKILRVQNDTDIQNLDPALRHGWYDEMPMYAIFQGLCQYKSGETWGWQLDAASELTQVDDKTISFTLKPGQMWTGDFGEMTAEDVKYSFERFLDPKLEAVYKEEWEALDRVEVLDKYKGVIHLKTAYAPLFTITLPSASGIVVCKAALEKNGGKIETDPFATSGPYKIKAWTPREKLVLDRNPAWTGTAPYFDEIHLIPIVDLKTAEIGYQAGDLDITKVALSSVPQIQKAADPKTTLSTAPALAYIWMGMNVEHPKLKDVRVRRAIQHAIDVPTILDTTFGGAVAPALGVVPSSLPGARTALLYGYDPEKSKALLAEAGVSDLSLKIDFSADTDYSTIAQIMQAQLAEVGITLEITPMDRAAFSASHMESKGEAWKDSQLFIVKFTTGPDASNVTAWYTCDQVGVWNWQRTCDPAWDAENKAATTETDPAKRAATYIDLQNRLEETGAYVFLYHGTNAWVSKAAIKGAYTPDAKWLMFRETTGA